MLKSKKIELRQSEIRGRMAELQASDDQSDESMSEVRSLAKEYAKNEAMFQAAIIAEDEQRADAASRIGRNEETERRNLLAGYELRQAVLSAVEDSPLSGATAELVQEMRSSGSYDGVPVPYAALEQRDVTPTVASGVPDPVDMRPIIDRLFPASMVALMGGQLVTIPDGQVEYPVTTSAVTAGWAASESGAVAEGPAFATTGRTLRPNHNLGVQMEITRRTLKQSAGAEQAIQRDMRGAIQAALDRAAFLGTGQTGQPLGIVAGANTYGIDDTDVDGAASYAAFRAEVADFMAANAASGPGDVRAMIRGETWVDLDDEAFDAGSGITEWDKLVSLLGAVHITGNALAAPDEGEVLALLTTTAGGVPPFWVGVWGGVDLIRDPYSKAASGSVMLTGIVTADVTAGRAAQSRVLSGITTG